MTVLQGLQQKAAGKPRFTHAGRAHQHQILIFGHKVEFGERAHLLAVHTGLARPRKRFQRPSFGQIRPVNPPFKRTLLTLVPLRAQQPRNELRVRSLRLLRRL